ncbi:MAG: hypothetical protein Solivirus3_33 [Solivirus sp.]|uniref:Uncharacterized protein n=1 Tax=Solivirus sp. TaxID=2487772 RepID=A0A3G5AJH0_9VIRU|nr:MAG: hypothetical protein Solivirus3_33 [Solivirus sp.]
MSQTVDDDNVAVKESSIETTNKSSESNTTTSASATTTSASSSMTSEVMKKIAEKKAKEEQAMKDYELRVSQMKTIIGPLEEEVRRKQMEMRNLATELDNMVAAVREIFSQQLSNATYKIPFKVDQLIGVTYGGKVIHCRVSAIEIKENLVILYALKFSQTDFGEVALEMALNPAKFEESMICYARPNAEKILVKGVKIL